MRTPGTSGAKIAFLFCFLVCFLYLSFRPAQVYPQTPLRSFNELFPLVEEAKRKDIFDEYGYIRTSGKNGVLNLIPSPGSGINIHNLVMRVKPSYLVESLKVLPYSGKPLDRLDAYNALGRIRDLKGRLYRSHSRNSSVPLFEDATRLESARKSNPIPDPAPAMQLPFTETVYLRLKDANFGNTYYRGEISTSLHGITYSLTNFKSLKFLFFTAMREEKFSAILYLEPLNEGMMIYSVAGGDVSDFIASRIDVPSAIAKRLSFFIAWISDGLSATVK